jgi:hypothetical protein
MAKIPRYPKRRTSTRTSSIADKPEDYLGAYAERGDISIRGILIVLDAATLAVAAERLRAHASALECLAAIGFELFEESSDEVGSAQRPANEGLIAIPRTTGTPMPRRSRRQDGGQDRPEPAA